jgi:hypothetical protein
VERHRSAYPVRLHVLASLGAYIDDGALGCNEVPAVITRHSQHIADLHFLNHSALNCLASIRVEGVGRHRDWAVGRLSHVSWAVMASRFGPRIRKPRKMRWLKFSSNSRRMIRVDAVHPRTRWLRRARIFSRRSLVSKWVSMNWRPSSSFSRCCLGYSSTCSVFSKK